MHEFGSQELPLSEFAARFDPYFSSGEINSKVSDPGAKIDQIRQEFAGSDFDDLDGITVSSAPGENPWWWFNVRSSNTEPLLRLNVESESKELCNSITTRVLAIIQS
jgi:phosphomannomutase